MDSSLIDRPLDPEAIAITAMNEAEIVHGIARLPAGQRQERLQQCWEELMTSLFAGEALPFNGEAAHWYGALVSRRERLARPITTADAVIAATTLAYGAQLATRNTADFESIGLELINPWIKPPEAAAPALPNEDHWAGRFTAPPA